MRVLLVAIVFVACKSAALRDPGGDEMSEEMQEMDDPASMMDPASMDPTTPAEVTCGTGFLKVGTECVDIDECATNNGGCGPKAGFICTNTSGAFTCACNPHCDYVIPITTLETAPKYYAFYGADVDTDHDGTGNGVAVKPGDHICFASGTRTGVAFFDVNGDADNQVVVSNMCDGQVTIDPSPGWGNTLSFTRSSNFRITGAVNPAVSHGIEIVGGNFGINLFGLSTKFEVDHLDVHDSESSAIVAKTDPTCDVATQRGHFTLESISIHDNEVQNTINEGFYIGNSHHDGGVDINCGGTVHVEEHEVTGVSVYNNVLDHTGNESIQIGGAKDVVVHHNKMTDAGYLNASASQSNAFQSGSGTEVTFYDNFIVQTGKGYGIFEAGGGGTYFNNVVIGGASGAISLQDIDSDWAPHGFTVFNNTFVGWKSVGVIMYTENPEPSTFFNNILVPAVSSGFEYIHLNNGTPGAIKWTASNNLQTTDLASVKFVSAATNDMRLTLGSPAINAGKDASLTTDHAGTARPQEKLFDIGAFEFVP